MKHQSIALTHLKTFLVAARLGSFTRAAHQLCLTQPAVSGHIAALEAALDVELFHRTGRQVVLTDAGRIVQKGARDVMDRLEAMEGELADLQDLKGGTIKIGASKIVGVYILPKILTSFQERFPDIQLRVSIHTAHTIAQLVLENAFDIAIVAEGDQFFSPNVGSKVIGLDSLSIVAPPDWVKRHFGRTTLSIEQACREPFILSGKDTASGKNLKNELAKLGITLNSTIEMDEAGAIKRAVEEGAGLAVLSRSVVERELEDGRLCELHIDGWSPTRDILMLWRHDRRFSKNTQAFMDFLKAELASKTMRQAR